MAIRKLLQDENLAQGIPANSKFQAGVSDVDSGLEFERQANIPWCINPAISWLDYQCNLECMLDAGVALHKPLPQGPASPGTAGHVDTLASEDLYDYAGIEKSKNGINLTSVGGFEDVVQQMATSTYRFRLRGYGLRAGYKVPIPTLKKVAGVPAIPAERQWAVNKIVSSASGIPIWLGQWDLWYYVTLPPKEDQVPPPNLALHVRGDAELPQSIPAPLSQPDTNAVAGAPPQLQGFAVQRR